MMYQQYKEWVKKNHFTMIGIIIILAIVWWYYATVEVRIYNAVQDCNEYWREAVNRSCPVLFSMPQNNAPVLTDIDFMVFNTTENKE